MKSNLYQEKYLQKKKQAKRKTVGLAQIRELKIITFVKCLHSQWVK